MLSFFDSAKLEIIIQLCKKYHFWRIFISGLLIRAFDVILIEIKQSNIITHALML